MHSQSEPKNEDPDHPEPRRPERFFFIVGTGRCGSTLLQSMLMCHPQVAVPPETHYFFRFDPALCPSGDPAEYAAWVCAQDWAKELGIEPSWFGGAHSARDRFLALCRNLLGGELPEVLGEKSPRHEKNLARIAEVFPEAVFIHICRDPRDVVLSLRKEHWASDQPVQRVARSVRKTLARLRRAEDAYPLVTVRYEDLIAEPEAELRRVCAHIGVGFDPAMLRFHERDDAGYLESEESWKKLTRSPLDPSRIGRYKGRMPDRDVRTVERSLGPELAAYGYERAEIGTDRLAWRVADAAERMGWWFGRQKRSASKRARKQISGADAAAGS